MKKIIFVLTFILSLSACVFASDVSVQINGEIVNFKDEKGNIVNAQIINSRTMVPMRKIFEILGAEINWDGANRKVTGIKGDTTIELQIDNPVATKVVNGSIEQIKLDTAPTIINNRTMVPLRFIAESLDKQVGWDASNRTAIIIDYSYFTNVLKTNATALYNFLNTEKEYVECNFTHKYYDLMNEVNNTTFNSKINAKIIDNKQKIDLTISGTNQLVKEIISENWNATQFDITYSEDSILFETENEVLKKMLITSESKTMNLNSDLNLDGNGNLSLDEMFEVWSGVKDNELNINTFSMLKNDFSKLCNLFNTNNTSGTQLSSNSSSIKYSTYDIKYFDLAKLDNFIWDNNHIKAINLINKIFFKYDILKDVMLYDTNNIAISSNINNGVMKITIVTTNDYNEKNEYIIELKHI